MKLLRVRASHFKNCADNYTIDLVAKSRKTAEDKEYELQEIAPGLFVFNTMAFIGKNASGKTSAVELLDSAYSVLGEFRIEDKHYSYDGTELELIFYHQDYLYLYETTLSSDTTGNRALFQNERIYRKKYFKTNIREIYDKETYELFPKPLFPLTFPFEMEAAAESWNTLLPEDTSKLFYVLKKKVTRAVFFDSFEEGTKIYRMAFSALKNHGISSELLSRVLRIFDENVDSLELLDENNYRLVFKGQAKNLSDTQLLHMLSSGTTKGLLLYILMAASLKEGFDLIVDEVENHFHKTLVENMISLYKDKSVNRHNASLIFTTHYCEVLDQMGRQDNIWVCRSGEKVSLSNMFTDYDVRPELLKSRQYYHNAFETAVDYDALMDLKRVLKK